MLRLKMSVGTVKSVASSEGKKTSEDLTFGAVYGSDPTSANRKWSQWTPSANLTMSINNPEAFDKVLPGQFVFVDITPCGIDD